MLVVASLKSDKKHGIYHKHGCIYARRIKIQNRKEMYLETAKRNHYRPCKYCSGLHGDVRLHKTAFVTWSRKKNLQIHYSKESNSLYIQTEVGFWKVYSRNNMDEYRLFHRNSYFAGMDLQQAIHGKFHRQADVKQTTSLEKIVDYIVAHDQAKVIIMDDYHKLPRTSKQQKKYYKAAERRDKKRALRRVESLFAALEQSQEGMRQYSFC